jgi:hypothetical protein
MSYINVNVTFIIFSKYNHNEKNNMRCSFFILSRVHSDLIILILIRSFSMMMFTLYIIVFSIIFGHVLSKPIEEKLTNEKDSQDKSIEQAFRQAEMTLNRYFYLMKSDTDHLVHAMLHVIMNNPTSFPYIPSRALDIALKNFEKKLGQNDVDILTKPILLSIEQNANKKSKQGSTFQLTDAVKEKIEDALDKFFEEQENISHV